MDAEETIAKGKEAERIMDNEVLQDCFKAIKAKQIDAFAQSDPLKSEQREYAFLMLKAIEELENYLSKLRADGLMEETRIKRVRHA